MIEMNNLRVLNDYLNQTIDALSRGPRMSAPPTQPFGYSPFAATPFAATPPAVGADVVWGQSPWGFTGTFPHAPYATPSPFTPGYTPGYTAIDPFYAQRGFAQGTYGSWQQPWSQPWSPTVEATRHVQMTHALAARQQVLEAMCRAAGIPV